MVALEEADQSLLHKPSDDGAASLTRAISNYRPLRSFQLPKERPYQQQFGDMYFLRLTKLKPAVEAIAAAAWADTAIGGELANQVDRVLDVRQGELCWVVGTVYMEMPLKPNVLDDVSKDRWVSAPTSVHKYISSEEEGTTMLEDESGRIRLVGDRMRSWFLVTGCIVAVMGTENASGEFEVIDLKFAELAPQPERWALSGKNSATKAAINGKSVASAGKKPASSVKAESEDVEMTNADGGNTSRPGSKNKIAIVSGLEFSGVDTSYAVELDLLLEYLLGEALGPDAQTELSHISRLIIAGNSINMERKGAGGDAAAAEQALKLQSKKGLPHKKYGYDSSAYNPVPSQLLDGFLSELLPSMPVTLIPGATDPSNASFPQQPVHSAMFPRARTYGPEPSSSGASQDGEPGWLDSTTNPWEGEVEGWRWLGSGGQNLDDVFKYVDSEDRLGMMEAMCRWRCSAPTAPDTLWAYPFHEDEPFIMTASPHLYFVGCQPKFGTKTIEGREGQTVRLVAIPSFSASGEIVLVDSETLQVSKVKIAVGK